MSHIASTGVPFALTLDLRTPVVTLRNHASFAGVTADKRALLRDLILPVVRAPALYERPLHQVAFEQVDAATALAEVEQRFHDLRNGVES